MATSGVFNGTNLLLKLSSDGGSTYTNLGHTTSSSISFSLDTPESTSKDSGGYREVIAGLRSIEISFDGLVAYDDGFGAESLVNILNNRTKIKAQFGTASSGDPVYTVDGFISSIEVSGEMESPVSYSGTFIATGSVSIAS
tara:strand:- start:365 stop:787 length:423 start_codon:yes stop_codon:yes gene_type:complete